MSDTPADSTSAIDKADAAFDAFESDIVKAGAADAAGEGSTPEPAVEAPVAETAKVEGSTPGAEAAPVAPEAQDAPEFQNLLAKYGGDKNAAAKSYWETAKTAATLTREKEELAQRLAAYEAKGSTPEVAKVQEAVREIPSELKRYDENIRKAETTFETTQADRAKFVAYGAQLDQEIRTLNRQIANPSLLTDRDELVAKLSQQLEEREKTTNWIVKLDGDLAAINERWIDLRDRRDIRSTVLEQAKELEAAREAKARSEEDRDVLAIRQTWDGAIERVAKDEKIIPADLSTGFQKYVRQAGKAFVADGTPIEDMDKFVRDTATEYVAEVKKYHEAQSALYGKQKRDDSKVEAPSGAAALASDTKRPKSDWTPEQWRAYEESVQL